MSASTELLVGRPSQQQSYAPAKARTERLGAIDIVRGLAMLFMLFNHATWHVPDISFRVNFGWDTLFPPLPTVNPLAWLGLLQGTPLFFIMTGFAVALFEQARRRQGWTEGQITRFLLIRGGILIAIDWLLLPWHFYPEPAHVPNAYFVLTSIGICLCCLTFLRRLPLRFILLIALFITIGTQIIYETVTLPLDVNLVRTIFLYMIPLDPMKFGFPVLPWLSVILLGYSTMRVLHGRPEYFARITLGISVTAWAIWFIVTSGNRFGVLLSTHPLLMTKHPPSLAYLSFYTGATFFLLYLLHLYRSAHDRFPFNQIALLGQTALIFYILHFHAIDLFSALLQNSHLQPLAMVLLITLLSLLLLYVICTRYRRRRKSAPNSLLQYL